MRPSLHAKRHPIIMLGLLSSPRGHPTASTRLTTRRTMPYHYVGAVVTSLRLLSNSTAYDWPWRNAGALFLLTAPRRPSNSTLGPLLPLSGHPAHSARQTNFTQSQRNTGALLRFLLLTNRRTMLRHYASTIVTSLLPPSYLHTTDDIPPAPVFLMHAT